MKKRIGIDAQVTQYREASGFGFYVNGLLDALMVAQPDDLEIVPLKSKWSENLPTWKRWYHDRIELNNMAKRDRVEIVHQPCFSCPKSNKKVIWTLHDLRSIVLSERMSFLASWYWKKWLPYSARYADVIICTSENTRRDAVKYLGLPESAMHIIPVGLPTEIREWRFDPVKATQYHKKFDINKPFFSTVGTIQPIKNIPFLITVFARLRKELELDYQLVIIGKKGWDYDNVVKALANEGLTEGKEVIITDYVSDDEKWSLVKSSHALLFPSLYEGFGIPPIEAQELGVPVLSSNSSSLPDVIGEGGVFCSPTKAEEWVAGYKQLQADRVELVKRGKTNAKRFYWEDIAKQWIKLYQSL